MVVQLKVQGDPRRPDLIRKYDRPKVNLDEMPPDIFLICGLGLGLVSLVLKAKVPAWGSLLFCLMGIANAKTGQSDVKQFVSAITFSVFGLVSSYIVPMRQRAAGGAT